MTQEEWNALTDAEQQIVAHKIHDRLVRVIKIAIDEFVEHEGDGFPAFSFLTALAEVAAVGVPEREPTRSALVRMFIRYFKSEIARHDQEND